MADLEHIQEQAAKALQLGDWPSALDAFSGLIKAMPKQAALHYNRALVLKQMERVADAVPDLETALDLDPTHANALFELASARIDLGQLGPADALLERYVDRVPDDPDGWLNRALLLVVHSRPTEARDAARRALELGAGPQVHLVLAEAERDAGDLGAAHDRLAALDATDPAVAAARLKVISQGAAGRITLASSQLWSR